MNPKKKKLEPIPYKDLDQASKDAVDAARTSAEKLLDLKRKLGHNIVIAEDGEVKIIPASEYELPEIQ